jgi:hypothetical protein
LLDTPVKSGGGGLTSTVNTAPLKSPDTIGFVKFKAYVYSFPDAGPDWEMEFKFAIAEGLLGVTPEG